MSAVLDVRNLTVSRGGKVAVSDVSLAVGAGEILAVLGPNGAGKSSLVMAVAGAIPIDAGRVFSGGEELTGRTPYAVRAAGIAAVPEGHRVLAGLSVQENLLVAGAFLPDPALKIGIDFAYTTFPELAERRDQQAGSMSGGQQQMLVLAQALVGQPKVILADEMSLGLAPLIVKRLLDVTRTLAQGGTGILLIEQYTHLALSIAERAMVMERGSVVFSGSSAELEADPSILHDAYLS